MRTDESSATTSRKAFLGGMAAFAGAAVSRAATPSGGGSSGTVRFLAFADIHYAPSGFWPQATTLPPQAMTPGTPAAARAA